MQQLDKTVQDLMDSETYYAYLKAYGTQIIGDDVTEWELELDPETDTAFIEFPNPVIHLPRQKDEHHLARLLHDHANLSHELLHLKYTDMSVTNFLLENQAQITPTYMNLVQFLEDGRIDRIGRQNLRGYGILRQAAATVLWRGNNAYSLSKYDPTNQIMQTVSCYVYPRPNVLDVPEQYENLIMRVSDDVKCAAASSNTWQTLFWALQIHEKLEAHELCETVGLTVAMKETIKNHYEDPNLELYTLPGDPLSQGQMYDVCQGLSEQTMLAIY